MERKKGHGPSCECAVCDVYGVRKGRRLYYEEQADRAALARDLARDEWEEQQMEGGDYEEED